jgi:eukaryotic-like serine/threonine-protein kinase
VSVDQPRVQNLFARAVALQPGARAAFLREACGDDETLHGEVSSLLELHDQDEPFGAPDPPPAAARQGSLAAGSLVGEYRIESLLGAGGMGEVYGASQPVIGKRVAIKVMSPHCSANPANVARFIDEAKAVNAIGHPNIVDIFSFGKTDDDRCYFVMEWLVGESLRARMDRGRLELPRVLDILDGVLRALEAAHAANVVHRDLKPDNIFLVTARDREPERVKLLDFGVAKLVERASGASASRSHRTETGTVVGTPSYMAPEQAAGKPVSGPSDIYSLGVVAFELVTGRLPFESDSGVRVMVKHMDEPPPRPSTITRIPTGVERLVMEMLAKAVTERPTATEACTRIERLRDDPGAPIGIDTNAATHSIQVPTSATVPGDAEPPASTPAATTAAVTRLATPGALAAHAARVTGHRTTRRRAGLVGAAIIAVAAALAVVLVMARRPDPARSPAPPPAPAAGDVPWFQRSPAGAGPSYAIGLRAIHDGYVTEAFGQLGKAEKATPWLAAAYLRRSILDRPTFRSEQSRVDFAHAVEHRDRLDARDQQILDACRHVFIDTPPDPAAWEDGLSRLSDQHPNDPELAYYAGLAHSYRGAPDAAMASFDRALAHDPQFAAAFAALASDALDTGDEDRARKAVDRCLALPRRSPACSNAQIIILSRTGDAAGVLAEALAWLKADPEHADVANGYRAEAMLALGRPLAAVEEVVHERTRRLTDARSRTKLFWQRQLAFLVGDFPGATRALRDQIDFADAKSIQWGDHAVAAFGEVQLDEELGRGKEAAEGAASFVAKQDVWIPDEKAPHIVVMRDPTPWLLAVELSEKRIDHHAFEVARDAWVAKWKTRLARRYWWRIWLQGYASAGITKQLAAEALAARAAFDARETPSMWPFVDRFALGRLYATAGDLEQARPHLDAALRALWTLHDVVGATQAEELYGEALEPTDRVGACAAYATVLARWGAVKASVTAARARARARALRCAGK